ncbi:MAG: hypothetical protein ABI689_00855 [Thermoanaerobaculia bacterium]
MKSTWLLREEIGLQADFDREKARASMAKTLAKIRPWPEAERARQSS